MADTTKTTRVASYDLQLVSEDGTDFASRTVSFDVPDSTYMDDVYGGASYFMAAGMSNVFQPTGWLDYGSESAAILDEKTYRIFSITPSLTEKTVTKGEEIFAETQAQKKTR